MISLDYTEKNQIGENITLLEVMDKINKVL